MKKYTYIVRFEDGEINHACVTKYNSVGTYFGDRMFGGGK